MQDNFSYWKRIPAQSKGEDEFHCVVEIPRGEKVKYEYSKMFDVLFLDRVLYSSVHYPENYGLVPRTLADDGDPLDVLLLCQEPLVPMTVAQFTPLGGLEMADEKGKDHKIFAVASNDPQYSDHKTMSDLPEHKLREIRQFFADYKRLEGKEVDLDEFYSRDKALEILHESIQNFEQEYPDAPKPEK